MNDQDQTRRAAVRPALRFAPSIPNRRDQSASVKSRLARLAVAFWCSLLVTGLTLVFALKYGVEVSRAPQRMKEARDQADRLEVEAAKKLSTAQAELKYLVNVADDLGGAAIRSSSPELGL